MCLETGLNDSLICLIQLVSTEHVLILFCSPVSLAVVLFGEPIRWETNLQLITDVLLTNGNLSNAYESTHSAHLPLLACNMDLMWMAEAQSPRWMVIRGDHG